MCTCHILKSPSFRLSSPPCSVTTSSENIHRHQVVELHFNPRNNTEYYPCKERLLLVMSPAWIFKNWNWHNSNNQESPAFKILGSCSRWMLGGEELEMKIKFQFHSVACQSPLTRKACLASWKRGVRTRTSAALSSLQFLLRFSSFAFTCWESHN